MAPTMKELEGRRDAVFAQANEIIEAADARTDKAMSDEESAAVARHTEELKDIGDKLAAAQQKERDDRENIAYLRALGKGVAADNERSDRETARVSDGLAKGRSLGALFAESPQYKAFMRQFPGGRIPESFKGINSAPVDVSMPAKMMAALLTGASDTAAGAFVTNDMQNIYVPQPMRPLTLIDLITVSGTDSDTVEYVRQTSRTNSAAPTAEATTTSNGTKPESAMAFEKVTHAVETVAHWIPATKRALADASQIRTIIDEELRYGLNEELEDQMMNGNGSTPNLRGLFNISNIQTQAYVTDLYTTTRKAITLTRTVARETPTGWVFNPSNWETFELLKDGENRYYHGGPLAVGVKSLWGYPVVECDAMLEGHAFLGNFRRAWLWMREAITVTASDSHASFFVQNLVAVLAELRAAFGVTKPSAFVKLSLSAAS